MIDGEQPAVPENPTPILEEDPTVTSIAEGAEAIDFGPTILSQAGRTVRKTEQVQIKTMTTHALSVVCVSISSFPLIISLHQFVLLYCS